MPRQQVNTAHEQEPSASGSPVRYSPVVELGWGGKPYENDPNGHGAVVLTMSISDEDVLERADSIRKRREQGHDHAAPVDKMAAWSTPPLTRAELNLLIRTARRARDRAYGTDE